MPKWDARAERDLLLIMRFLERSNGAVPKDVWDRAAEIMDANGHPKFTPKGISLRWYAMLKKFQQQHDRVLGVDAGSTGLAMPSGTGSADDSAAATTPSKKAKRKRAVKDDDAEDKDKMLKLENDDTDDAADTEASPAKKLGSIRMGTEA